MWKIIMVINDNCEILIIHCDLLLLLLLKFKNLINLVPNIKYFNFKIL